MMRKLSVLLSVFLLASVLSVYAFAEDELDIELYSKYYISNNITLADCYWVMFDNKTDRGSIGDVNSDGSISLTDCAWIMQHVAGWDHSKYTVSEWGQELSLEAADVTGDGKVNLIDASFIMKYIAGWFDRDVDGGGEDSNLFVQWMYYCKANEAAETPYLSYFDWLKARE